MNEYCSFNVFSLVKYSVFGVACVVIAKNIRGVSDIILIFLFIGSTIFIFLMWKITTPILMWLCNYFNYFAIRQIAKTLANTINTIDTYHGAMIAIDKKIAIILPKTQLRFCCCSTSKRIICNSCSCLECHAD